MNLILLLKYIILGIIQGFTEPIPISSSGHLLIVKKLFNFNIINDINFEIIVNFGSFLAITYLYRKEILNIISDFFLYIKTKNNNYKENYNYAFLIIVGTIPAGMVGFLLKDKIDVISNNIQLIGIALIITSCFLYIIKDIKGKKEKKDLTYKDALFIGFFQIISLFPGISRSGSTIVGASLKNLNRTTAVNFSFMLYLPISIATMLLGIGDLISSNNLQTLFIPYFISMIISMIVTYYSSKWFINVVKNGKLGYFSIYCLIIGMITLLFL